MSNDMILNFHDAVLYQSDLEILKSNAWLNDACIHFFLTKLSKDLESPSNCRLKFVDPSVLSFFMHQWNEEEDGDEDIMGLKQQDQGQLAVFLPINDNYVSQRWSTPGGGTHWSLLLLLVTYNKGRSNTPSAAQFWHFDSSAGSNARAAQAVAQKIQRVTDQKEIHFQECTVPQQQNGYDCGIHTLATAQAFVRSLSNNSNNFEIKELEEIVKGSVETSPSFCSKMRQRIAQDIETMAANKSS